MHWFEVLEHAHCLLFHISTFPLPWHLSSLCLQCLELSFRAFTQRIPSLSETSGITNICIKYWLVEKRRWPHAGVLKMYISIAQRKTNDLLLNASHSALLFTKSQTVSTPRRQKNESYPPLCRSRTCYECFRGCYKEGTQKGRGKGSWSKQKDA